MGLSTHVLDTARGRPAAGVAVVVERDADGWVEVARVVTDDDGRATGLEGTDPAPGIHRLTFAVGEWFRAADTEAFWPTITVSVVVDDPDAALHVPLLLSPYGYSTYRGS